ncbi:acetyl-CoA acetyltransferase [Salipiger pallidus]|uniref:Acetyl-CoA acetyltransferase n=1 Tax=Salipiger pallidus TaxID=1775170 RepID=A0A8J2ZKL1_9RHOB|nr:acetyl-CoA acetyltransferase [Salipiger pallidus]GGG74006.1 acetyl-CoA acetyltransferase [Salipiger pallidus]
MTLAQIAGWAHTRFGKSEAPDTEALLAEVVPPALDHAGVPASMVDGIFVGCFNNGFSKQDFIGALPGMVAEDLALKPAVRVENACATGSAALYAALDFIESGRGKVALVVGVEKMTALPTADVGDILLGASYRKEEADVTGGFAGLFGRIAQSYFQKYGDQSEALAMIASKNHTNGAANPYAHMQKAFSVEQCNTISDKNPYVAQPLRRTDCSLISDGAAAMIVVHPDIAADLERAIAFRASTHTNDVLALSRRDPIAFDGARRAWAGSLEEAGMTLDDLDFVETHDCFTIAELIEYEAMGLAEPGKGADVIRNGVSARGGKLPINLSGGLKSKGHPIGATGVSMHVMAAMQLAGEAPEGVQAEKANVAGVFNMGGAAVANYCSIMERVK